jgi:hypothetical protein
MYVVHDTSYDTSIVSSLRFPPLGRPQLVCPDSDSLTGLGSVPDLGLSPVGEFMFLVLVKFMCLRWNVLNKVHTLYP